MLCDLLRPFAKARVSLFEMTSLRGSTRWLEASSSGARLQRVPTFLQHVNKASVTRIDEFLL